MFANATARRLARASRTTVAVDLDFEDGTVTTFRPAKRPARRNIRQAAIRASQLGLTV
ncbi:hypothetical protein [Micromonospora carbonacea]|uniref:Uncharacterized protein n=1 Tax=Micromonospora carbonacea TaxID=47853 RepID=A0A1C5AAY9_9ACTN|nr:hypothetical protein [Micromonospora carbonacea]SCF42184.1 hypothetical protein GA0070563_11248 [Micromonospora carbonacea]